MRCEDLMRRRLVTVGPDDTVLTAATRMRAANVGFLPVVDKKERALGALTDRDIVVRAGARNRRASEERVSDVMTKEVVGCHGSDEVEVAEGLMEKHHVRRLMVLASDGTLMGIISLDDLAARLQNTESGAVLRHVTELEVRPRRKGQPAP